MRLRKVVRRPIRIEEDGVNVEGGVNAVVAANINEPGSSQRKVSSNPHASSSDRGGGPEPMPRRRGPADDDQRERGLVLSDDSVADANAEQDAVDRST